MTIDLSRDSRNKDIFYGYGLYVYKFSILEQNLINMLIFIECFYLIHKKTDDKNILQQIYSKRDEIIKKTFGRVIEHFFTTILDEKNNCNKFIEINKVRNIDTNEIKMDYEKLKTTLTDVLKDRNYVIHQFFIQHSLKNLTDEKFNVIRQDLSNFINKVSNTFELVINFGNKYICEDWITQIENYNFSKNN